MNFIQKNIVGLVAIVIAIGGFYFPSAAVMQQVAQQFGGVTNYDEVDATAIKVGGTNGSRVGPIIATTCNLLEMDSSAVATTTNSYDCAVTGIVAGDRVIAILATSSVNSIFGTWQVQSAYASSTSGFATLRITNLTGGNATPSATAIGSSTQIYVFHPVTSVPGL